MIKKLIPMWLALLWISSVSIVNAQLVSPNNGFPEPTDRYINDFADIITPQDEARIRRVLIDLEERSDVEGTVVTINSISEYPTGVSTIQSFAAGLFDEWGIGNRTTNDGVLVLVALEDRELQIELGENYRNEYNVAIQRIIEDDMLPLFREGSFSLGIVQGTELTIERIIGPRERAKQSGASTFPTPVRQVTENINSDESASPSAPPSRSSSSISIWAWLAIICALVAVGVLGFNFYRIRARTRPRQCPNCDELMELLDEDEDDLYLDTGQRAEEYLKSVDYDVWLCPNDGVENTYPHEPLFSKYSKCPTCSYKTVDKYDQVLEQPTVYSTGRKQIVADCYHCDYHRAETVILPRIQRQVSAPRTSSGGSRSGGWSSSPVPRPSSSSSRTFGGGRSGGGGGSGSW